MTIPNMPAQQPRAAEGKDPRGWLCFSGSLPEPLQSLEDSRAAADFDNRIHKPRGFDRQATQTERDLLAHLGHVVPDELTTHVRYYSKSCRNRTWPQIEAQETS